MQRVGHQCCICKEVFGCTRTLDGLCADYEDIGYTGMHFYCASCWIDYVPCDGGDEDGDGESSDDDVYAEVKG